MEIRPISDLRNYPNVIEDVTTGNPVYLTKNGHGAYVLMEIAEFEEYSKERALLQLLVELNKADISKTIPYDDVKKRFEEKTL